MIAAVLCAVHYVAYEAKWYSALAARVTPITTISGPARVIDGDTVVVAGLLTAMALCAGAALVLSFLHWKEWKAKPAFERAGIDQGGAVIAEQVDRQRARGSGGVDPHDLRQGT